MKRDLLKECNDQGLPAQDFENLFCQRCKNRSCERAKWATSTWDERISTQMDRLILNPNISLQGDSSRWENIANFTPISGESLGEIWGAPVEKAETPPEETLEEILAEAEEPPPSKPEESPIKAVAAFNTPPQNIMIGGGAPPPAPTKVESDPWAIPSVKVGGTFKMGG